MDDAVIKCPKCQNEIKLTETLTAPLIEAERIKYREYHDREIAKVKEQVQRRELDLQAEAQRLTKAEESLAEQVEKGIREARTHIAEEEARKARLVLQADLDSQSGEIKTLTEALAHRNKKLAEAQKAQADLLKKERELEDARQALELTVEEKVTASLTEIKDRAKREVDETWQLKLRDKEHRMSQMQKQIEELQRQADQGSQQSQGEVFEIELEELLRREFPLDVIDAVGKGELGADLLQHVGAHTGSSAGTILWEVKRTKTWSDSWLTKLRGDQRAANADVALIVSHALPKGLDHFSLKDGVWVTGPQCALPVALALRELLLSVAAARKAGEGQLTKKEMLYEYLTGPRFRHRISAIVEQFTEMQADLHRERKVITKQWAKREQQIRCVIESTAGMYGDLQGIAGQSIVEVEGLSIELLAAPEIDEAIIA